MDWIRLLPLSASLDSFLLAVFLFQSQVLCLHIRPQPCQNLMGDHGTCMFVWECIKTEGKHLGTCADGFLFGSCCAHSDSKNTIIPSASEVSVESHRKNTTFFTPSKQPSTNIYSSKTTLSPFVETSQISHFTNNSHHLKPSTTTFRPIFTSSSFQPSSSTFKPTYVKTTSKPYSTPLKPPYRPTFKPSSVINNINNVRPSFKPSTSSKPAFVKPVSKPFSTISKPEFVWSTSKPESTTSKPVYVRPTHKTTTKSEFVWSTSKPESTTSKPAYIRPTHKTTPASKPEIVWSTSKPESTAQKPVYVRPTHKTTTTFKPIFVWPTTKPTVPTIIYHPVDTESNYSPGNISSAIKTTRKPPLESTTKKYGLSSSTHKWSRPTNYPPSQVSTKEPYFPVKSSTAHVSFIPYWTSNYSYFRPSWKPSLKPTSLSTTTPNPFIYTYSTNNYATRPSFTPFATRSTRPQSQSPSVHFTTLSFKPSLSHVTTSNYSTDLTTTSDHMVTTTLNENFFTTNRPFTTSYQTTSNPKPFSPTTIDYFKPQSSNQVWFYPQRNRSTTVTSATTIEYFKPQSSNHGWFYPQRNRSTTVASPTTSFFTSQENNFSLSNVSSSGGFINEGTHRTSEAFTVSTFTASHPLDLSSEPVKLTEIKTTTPFPVSPCGTTRPHPRQKVVGGKNSAFGSWPWQASVRRTSFFGFSSTHRCGGALISREWVATAGHCVDDLLIGQIKIRVGEYDFASVQEPHGYVERGIVKKVVHPRYNFFTYENDLALVKLEEPIELEKHPHIFPICLPPNEENLVGKNATVTGWGRLSEGGVLPSILQEVQVPIISNEKCKNMFLAAGRHEYIPDIFLCAGFEEGGRDSCQGDSGGPLQIKTDENYWYLAGIISWGIGCAEPNMPGVCTRISKFKDWIVTQIA